jgi:hypothetical protein
VPFALRATPELRLTRRETFIRDALLRLTRHLDDDLRRRAYDAALDLGHEPGRARALAAAVTVQDAVAARRRSPGGTATATLTSGPLVLPALTAGADGPAGAGDSQGAPGRTAFPEITVATDFTDLLQDIEAVSRVLREPAEIEAVRTLAAARAPASTADAESGVRVRE